MLHMHRQTREKRGKERTPNKTKVRQKKEGKETPKAGGGAGSTLGGGVGREGDAGAVGSLSLKPSTCSLEKRIQQGKGEVQDGCVHGFSPLSACVQPPSLLCVFLRLSDPFRALQLECVEIDGRSCFLHFISRSVSS
mmetsp:Transcript_33417/g.66264  ORF Transcript_33417/g.66264 Transcript_33417/m.66264 type:complete len:137 (+) Transcript_33417:166-576(+)